MNSSNVWTLSSDDTKGTCQKQFVYWVDTYPRLYVTLHSSPARLDSPCADSRDRGIQDSPDHRTVRYKGVKFIWIYSNREIIEVFLKEIYENFVGTLETVRNREVSVPWRFDCTTTVDRKILKSRGGAYGGTYVRREICVSKLIGLALQVEGNLLFFLCFTLYLRAIFQVQAPGGAYIWRGDLTEGFLRYRFGGI